MTIAAGWFIFPQQENIPRYSHIVRHSASVISRIVMIRNMWTSGSPGPSSGIPASKKALSITKALNPFPGVHILAEIPRTTEFEDAPKGFFIDKPEGILPDVFSDEQMLVVETDEGLDVFLGCSHPGVINCLKHVMKCFPGRSIHALVAGMHLGTAAPSRIEMTIGHMAAMKIQKIVPLHCTGITAICEMKRCLKEHCFIQFTGDVLHI